MKNIKVFLTLRIKYRKALVLIPKNIAVQQAEETGDYTMTKEEINAKITEFKTKHPKFPAEVEDISNLDLKL